MLLLVTHPFLSKSGDTRPEKYMTRFQHPSYSHLLDNGIGPDNRLSELEVLRDCILDFAPPSSRSAQRVSSINEIRSTARDADYASLSLCGYNLSA